VTLAKGDVVKPSPPQETKKERKKIPKIITGNALFPVLFFPMKHTSCLSCDTALRIYIGNHIKMFNDPLPFCYILGDPRSRGVESGNIYQGESLLLGRVRFLLSILGSLVPSATEIDHVPSADAVPPLPQSYM
jgi:hypothetical protein